MKITQNAVAVPVFFFFFSGRAVAVAVVLTTEPSQNDTVYMARSYHCKRRRSIVHMDHLGLVKSLPLTPIGLDSLN